MRRDDGLAAWGDDVRPNGQLMANTWQGKFPYRNDGALGWVGTSRGRHVPAERFWSGRHDRQRVGVDHHLGYTPRHRAAAEVSGSLSRAPAGDPSVMQTLKGGSHLCAPRVLPPLPPGRPVLTITGQCHDAHRFSLCRRPTVVAGDGGTRRQKRRRIAAGLGLYEATRWRNTDCIATQAGIGGTVRS